RLAAGWRHERATEAQGALLDLVGLGRPYLRLIDAAQVDHVGLRAVGRRRPLRAAVRARADQDRIVAEGCEDPAGWVIADVRSACLGHERVADWERLRRGGVLRPYLRHLLLIDADQRLTIVAIKQVDPAGLARMTEALDVFAIDGHIEQHGRADRVV